jgi:high-affinity iron transporter
MEGGTYLVVRRIRMLIENWDRTALRDQEDTIGRTRVEGAPLGGRREHDPLPLAGDTIPANAHVRLARGAGAEALLRRSYSYVAGVDQRTGQLDAGLLFLAFQRDPRTQFVPIQARIASDALAEYIRPVGSAVFAVFPGARPGEFVGQGLFGGDGPQALLSVVGAALTHASAGPSGQVREDLADLRRRWSLAPGAGSREGRAVEHALAAAENAAARGDRDALALALSRLSAALAALAPRVQRPAAGEGLREAAAAADTALAAGRRADWSAARAAYRSVTSLWPAVEAPVRAADPAAYGDIESHLALARAALQPEQPEAARAERALGGLASGLRRTEQGSAARPARYTAWDAGFILVREGLEALLAVTALLALLRKSGQAERQSWVWLGVGSGIVASAVAGVALASLTALAAGSVFAAQEGIEGILGLVAVAMMLTIGFWLHGKTSIQAWNAFVRGRAAAAVTGGSGWALALVAFVAIAREGVETVIFYIGIAPGIAMGELALGVVGALVPLVVLGWFLLRTGARIPLRPLFLVATLLIYALAFKILGESVHDLQAGGLIPVHPAAGLPALPALGIYAAWEGLVPQMLLVVAVGIELAAGAAARRRGAEAKRV